MLLLASLLTGGLSASATGAPCPGRPDALGTERVMVLDSTSTPRIGRKQFPSTLPLADKELVLTFDDGPWPGTTERVLDTLARECVRATFFPLGRNAARYPELARREMAEGHTVGSHTFSHPLLSHMSTEKAEAEIARGIAAVDTAAYGSTREPPTRFFRFPGFASSPALLERLAARGIVVFGADLWASDWEPMTPNQELHLVLSRIEKQRRGIVLLHDTKKQTAVMLPALLRELKTRGYRIVHAMPLGSPGTAPLTH